MTELPIYQACLRPTALSEQLLRLQTLGERAVPLCNAEIENYRVQAFGLAYDKMDEAMQEMARARRPALAVDGRDGISK